MRPETQVGPGGYALKMWKTKAGAERAQKTWIEAWVREVVPLVSAGKTRSGKPAWRLPG